MFEDREKLRQSIIVTILAAYLVPILTFTFLSTHSMEETVRWLAFSIGILLAIVGSISLILSFLKWESTCLVQAPALEPAALPKPQDDHLIQEHVERVERQLNLKLDRAKQKWHEKKKDHEQLELKFEQMQNEHETLLKHSQEQLKKKDLMLAEYAQTVNDLRGTMEKKQDQIEKLQDSVHDLSYDLDTLLKLSEFESIEDVQQDEVDKEPKVPVKEVAIEPRSFGREEAAVLLKKCINIAQKLTTSQFSTSSRFRDLPIASTALDQRRLFESFRSETSSIIVMYSMKDSGLYFANDMTKQVLGWNPDKFVQEFFHLVQGGEEEWKEALQRLSQQSETDCHLVVRDRSDELIELDCCLGMIPTGAFKNYAVGILFKSKKLKTV